MFPNECFDLVEDIQKKILDRTGKHVEVMVYGDGAFKDPQGKIWKLADPVVSPAYTAGLEGTPNEIKLKYLADNDFVDLTGEALKEAISQRIKEKGENLVGDMASRGTTPRKITDLIGSLCDLTSGSGDNVKNAFYIGALSAVSYLACYFCKNILSVVSPQIVETSGITVEFIGTLSTFNMIFYAIGQLVNGIIGDKVKAKYLVSIGLLLSGVCSLFMTVTELPIVMIVAYSLIGFFLSMLYAPLVKVIAENTHPTYAMRCCLALTFASLFGVPVAGAAAMFFQWENVFRLCGVFLAIVAVACFCAFVLFEKRGIVTYKERKSVSQKGGSIKVLFEHAIVKFTFVAVLTGIVRTSVVFWVPTYLTQYLGFSAGTAASIFTVMSFVQSASPYINNLILYEQILKRNINAMLLLSFSLSTISFVMMFAVQNPFVNIVFLILALMTSNGASEMLWSVYCPSLRDTGMVSSATGYLDFMSYAAAGVANLLFANAISQIGWGNLILVWAMLMLAGVVISLPLKKKWNKVLASERLGAVAKVDK